MKKLKSLFLLVGLLALSVASCKKDDAKKVDEEEDLRSTKMTYKVDGTAKTSTHLFAVKDDEAIAVYGAINDSETIVLSIDNFHGTGDYTVDNDEVVIGYVNGTNPLNSFYATSGTIKVTSSSNAEVKGTFSGSLINGGETTRVLSDGTFEAKIVEAQD